MPLPNSPSVPPGSGEQSVPSDTTPDRIGGMSFNQMLKDRVFNPDYLLDSVLSGGSENPVAARERALAFAWEVLDAQLESYSDQIALAEAAQLLQTGGSLSSPDYYRAEQEKYEEFRTRAEAKPVILSEYIDRLSLNAMLFARAEESGGDGAEASTQPNREVERFKDVAVYLYRITQMIYEAPSILPSAPVVTDATV